jgi:DNA-binding MarR family transcriptional regulator
MDVKMEAKNKLSQQFLNTIPTAMSFLAQAIKDGAQEGLGVTQFRILSNIDSGIKRVKDIAEMNGVSQPAISKMVESMVAKNLIIRQKDGQDRRSSLLAMTIKGRDLYEEVELKASMQVIEKLNGMSEIEMKEIQVALEKIESLVLPKF